MLQFAGWALPTVAVRQLDAVCRVMPDLRCCKRIVVLCVVNVLLIYIKISKILDSDQ